jgi:hypothetical protein
MVKRKLNYLLLITLFFLVCLSCSKEDSNEQSSERVKISFRLINDGEPLDFTTQYLNGSGEFYTVNKFKFYISNIRLTTLENKVSAEKESYHLIDRESPESKEISPAINKGSYKSIEFVLGVDSLRNVSGAQTGALDPTNGMFWTWNSGYIFAKLEGKSPASTAPGQTITYHIGGFKTGENAQRKISLDFPSPVVTGKTTLVVIDVDLAKWFDGQHKISIAANPSLMTPGGLSLSIADNYATMFSIEKVINP